MKLTINSLQSTIYKTVKKLFVDSQLLNVTQRGYTFIELLIVFSIIGIISSIGIASFVGFNNSRALDGAAADIANALTTARQRALSQIKPPECTVAQSLRGYSVILNATSQTYQVSADCSTSNIQISTKKLPPQITFAENSQAIVFFAVPNATVDKPAAVTLNGFGKTKRVLIDPSGAISVR